MTESQANIFNRLVHTQVINLDRSPQRLATLKTFMDAAGVTFDRFPAFDGKLLDLKNDPLVTGMFDLRMWAKRHHRNPIPADVGCYLSHFKAVETFLKQDKDFGLVFEDDAVLAPDFIARVLPAIQDPGAWDILKLHARHPGPLVTRRVYSDKSRLCSFVTKHTGATGYIVNKAAAKKMLAHMVPAVRMNDWVYDEGHRMNLRVRMIAPMPVSLQNVASTIEADRDKSKRTWIEKHTDRPLLPRWSLPFRRAADDIHRVVYNLFLDGGLAAMIGGPGKPRSAS